jgi:hypothetical protein
VEVPGRRRKVREDDVDVRARNTDMVRRLEERRKVKGAAYYERKKVARRQLAEAQKSTGDQKTKDELAKYGY